MLFTIVTCNPSAPTINFKYVFAEARARVGHMKQETLAGYMGITEQQLSMQLAENGHPSLRRLALAARQEDPDAKDVVAEIFAILGEELGLGDCHPLARAMVQSLQATAAVIDVLGRLQMKMARADIAKEIVEPNRRRA